MAINWHRTDAGIPADVQAELVQADAGVREWEKILAQRIQVTQDRIRENDAILAQLQEGI